MGAFVQKLIGLIAAASAYSAVAFTTGGIAGLAAHFFGASSKAWFAYGFFIAPGPLYLYFSSDCVMRQQLLNLRALREEGLITGEQYSKVRERALEWYSLRRFGKPENDSMS